MLLPWWFAMNTNSLPWSIISSSVEVGIQTDGWNLAEPGSDADEARSFTVQVSFVSPFTMVPVLHLGLAGLDTDQRDSTRISLKPGLITESGFQAVITTWSGSRIYGVAFNWLALGS